MSTVKPSQNKENMTLLSNQTKRIQENAVDFDRHAEQPQQHVLEGKRNAKKCTRILKDCY